MENRCTQKIRHGLAEIVINFRVQYILLQCVFAITSTHMGMAQPILSALQFASLG